MDYNANALSMDALAGTVVSAYWSVEHNGRRRSGIVNVASLPPFANEAAAIQAAKDALGPAFIAALEAEMAGPAPGAYPPLTPPVGPIGPPPENPAPVFVPASVPPPDPPIVPPFVPL